MSLRARTLLLLGTGIAVLTLTGALLASTLWLGNLRDLEVREMERNLERLEGVLRHEERTLLGTAQDWAEWDETFEFARGKNPGFPRKNILPETFEGLRLDFMSILGARRSVWRRDPATGEVVRSDMEEPHADDGREARTEIWSKGGTAVVVARRAIKRSGGEGEPAGTLLLGRNLDEDAVSALGSLARVSLRAVAPGDRSPPWWEAGVGASPREAGERERAIRARDDDTLEGEILLRDSHHEPALLLVVEEPREILREGRRWVLLLTLSLAAAGLLLGAGMLALLQRQVVGRVGRLSAEVERVGRGGDLSRRVAVEGEDEIASMAAGMNAALADLEKAVADREAARGRLREAEEELDRSLRQELVGRVAGGVAHHFNNLLVVILGRAELEAARFPEGDRTRNALEEIRRAGERAAALVRELLAFAGRQVMRPADFDLRAFLRERAGEMGAAAGKGVAVRLPPEGAPLPVRADPGQIGAALVDIAEAAGRAMRGSGTLDIEASEASVEEGEVPGLAAGRFVLLRVTDGGPGLDPEAAARLFDPFYVPGEEGVFVTRFGLAAAHGILRQSGGNLSVASPPGGGTSYLLHIPRAG
ncbi:MAG: HAMP domain-containing protein [Planctomycetes bacterium]|nr:HAMP domain-containing protein [Planctomycetota bacterium]